MPYQKQTKSDNRRIWRKAGIDPEDGEMTYKAVNYKIKDKRFARPIILTGKMASQYLHEIFMKANPDFKFELNDLIEKASENLSKIDDVDKWLSDLRSGDIYKNE